ncbi:MAG: alpha/beta hydrolase [Acidobacteria bacterium]|nr:alpha/beta hydrolase [Acidobacteriota bacterium]
MLILLLCSLAAVGLAQAPAAKVPDNVEVDANVAYAQYPETRVDVYRQKGAANAKRPGVLLIHGGGWVNGTKEAMLANWVLPYLSKGFVVANVEYRLAKAAKAPAAVEDVLAAGQWFLRNAAKYGVDRKRIVVSGGSAGGHLSLMVGLTPGSAKLGKPVPVAAVVNFYGITDVGDQLSGTNMRKYAVEWLPEQNARYELARRVSPMTYVRRKSPAVLTIHGDQDETVPYEHGVQLTKALRDAGADAEMITVEKGRHGFPAEKMKELYVDIFKFLERRGIKAAE